MSTEPEPGLAPEHTKPPHANHDPIMIVVDGQDFRVRERAERPGEYDFDWLSGPHEYGFGITRAGGSGMTVAEMHEVIDNFREVLRSRGKIPADPEILGDAAAFEGVARYAARVKCAMISWVAAEDALNQAA